MQVVLLGTGASAGVPLIGGADGAGDWGACDPKEPRNRRSRSSIVVRGDGGGRILVDTGPDMRSQLLDCRISGIDAVIFTHPHADHITGLDDVRILNRIAGRPLEAFATEQTLAELTRRFSYAFQPWKPPGFFRPVLEPRPIAFGDAFEVAGMLVQAFRQDHGRSDSLGLRIGPFGYSTDVRNLDDRALETLRGVHTWVVGCFLRHGPHWTHADLPAVMGWSERIGATRTVLTHMGTDMDWAWLHANLPAGIEPGFDGMVLEVGTRP